MGAKGNVTGR